MDTKTFESIKIIVNQRGYHFASTDTGKIHYNIVKEWIDNRWTYKQWIGAFVLAGLWLVACYVFVWGVWAVFGL